MALYRNRLKHNSLFLIFYQELVEESKKETGLQFNLRWLFIAVACCSITLAVCSTNGYAIGALAFIGICSPLLVLFYIWFQIVKRRLIGDANNEADFWDRHEMKPANHYKDDRTN